MARGLLHRYGPASMKKEMWDREFSGGRWTCLEQMEGDCVYPVVEQYARHGSILDLGCGPGATGNELNADSYASYTGVDISEVAVEKARQRSEQNGRSPKNQYFQSDMLTYQPAGEFDVILYGDSIYYLPLARIVPTLQRYARHLKPNGAFVVRIFDWAEKHHAIIAAIQSNFKLVEKRSFGDGKISVLVFQPGTRD